MRVSDAHSPLFAFLPVHTLFPFLLFSTIDVPLVFSTSLLPFFSPPLACLPDFVARHLYILTKWDEKQMKKGRARECKRKGKWGGGRGRGNERNGKGRTTVGTNGEVMGEMQEDRGKGMSAW